MKLIKPNLEILEQQPGLDGIYKQIELAGRTCYKSEDKITEDSAKAFVDRMLNLHHGSVLEHGSVYLKIPIKAETSYRIDEYKDNPYTKTKIDRDLSCYYISTNYRVLVEHNWLDDLQYICEPTEYHEKRITVKWTCDKSILAEFTRHRTFSFAAESTRYCNYSKNKFGNELTFIIPTWYAEDPKNDKECCMNSEFELTCEECEKSYLRVLSWGGKPQEARQYLPFSLKTELVMTGFESDWKHFFSLRSPKAGATGVHPDAAYLADMLYDKLNNKQSVVHINVDGVDLYMHEDEHERWKKFERDMEEKFIKTMKLK